MAQIMPKYHLACRRGGAFCKSIVSTARRGGVPFVRTKGTKIRLGLCSKTPYPLSCGWIRSQGACGAFYFVFCRNRIKNQPYKRRLAPDPGVRSASGRGVSTRCGSLGRSPEGLLPTFLHRKVGPRRVGVLALHPAKSPRRRRRLPIWLKNTFAPFLHRKGGPRR